VRTLLTPEVHDMSEFARLQTHLWFEPQQKQMLEQYCGEQSNAQWLTGRTSRSYAEENEQGSI
jgi:hypothetical protein